ncbi:MAG: MerR family transcriptional regulator [Acidobacteriota bacterium]|nr:MerR family transcriptional regulator [Acidobacteriota bacterium]
MVAQASRKRAEEQPVIPDRLYFKIGDVARLCKVETYVLRFWETQFPQLKPNKSGTGQRLYRRREVELALEIKRLVHGEGYTISGARQVLGQLRHTSPAPASPVVPSEKPPVARNEKVVATIGHVRAELREIAGLLAASQPNASRKRARVASMPNHTGVLFPS